MSGLPPGCSQSDINRRFDTDDNADRCAECGCRLYDDYVEGTWGISTDLKFCGDSCRELYDAEHGDE